VINYSKVKRNKFSGAICGCLLSVIMMLPLSGCGGGSDQTYTISGRITSAGSPLAGVTVILAGDTSMIVTTDANGNYTFSGVPGGTFTVTPSLAGSPFRPLFRNVWLDGIDGAGFDFVVHGLGRMATATHTIYVKDDGTVWAWGNNNNGQLGDGSATSKNTPVQVSGLSGMTAVAAGSGHTVALKNDGTVWAWGNNSNGQLGDGSAASKNTPVQVSGLYSMTAVAAGSGHTVALKNDGTVWAWGNNSTGQLGNGNFTPSNPTPAQVSGLSGMSSGVVIAVAAGYDHTVALKNDGTVWAWGNNATGQLGNGNITPSNTPVQVSGLSGVTAVAAGFGHTVALKSDGTVRTWGNNTKGQLGNGLTNGTTIDSAIPVVVSGMVGVTDIAAGYEGSVVLKGAFKGDGTVWAWGSNSNGQLGNGLAVDSAIPVQANMP